MPTWFWTGRVHYWHAWASLAFVPAILGVCWIYLRTRVCFRPTHVILLGSGLLAAVSGYLLANPPQSEVLYWSSLWTHSICGLVVIPVWFLWHLLTGVTRYLKMLVPAFHPWAEARLTSLVGFLVLAAACGCMLMNGWPIRFPWRDLVAARIPTATHSDLAALPWDSARPLLIALANGANLNAGRTEVSFRALHDDNELFVRVEWLDADASYDLWPWKKTASGWDSLQTSRKDECRYYEDKFSLFFPIQPSGDFERFGCAASCHLDPNFSWGYKGSSYLLDTWHWKAARTGSVGQVDDQYCDKVDYSQKKVGRHDDPNQGGGYTSNRNPETDHPLFLPDSLDAVHHGIIPKARAVEYTEKLAAAIAPGTIIPGLVAEPFRGDQGDVTCQSDHRDGRWTLYVRRKLQTGSQYDTQFAPGGRYAFGCAAFDHAGKRHAYALSVYHLILQP